MKDSTERDTFRPDRLPDVRPTRATASYTRFLVSEPGQTTARQPRPPIDEPAWWEVDEAATLPDARRWRAGSIIDSHLPLLLRTVLESTDQRRSAWGSSRPGTGDLESVLGGSRYGTDDPVPVWTDAEMIRERSTWQDEPPLEGSGRRQKRGKRNRQDRQGERRRDHGTR